MKKLISTIVMFSIIIIGTLNSYAANVGIDANIEVNLNGQTSIETTTKTVELTLALGSFIEVADGGALGYQAVLNYDSNMFTTVSVSGLNGWNVEYAESTKKVVGDVASSKPNTNITKITLTVKDGITVGQTGTVSLNNIQLTDGTNDFTYNKDITITVKGGDSPSNSQNNGTPSLSGDTQNLPANPNLTVNSDGNSNGNSNSNTNTNGTPASNKTTTSKSANQVDKTTSGKTLPSTGIENILLIAIVVSVLVMIFFKFKSRKIK